MTSYPKKELELYQDLPVFFSGLPQFTIFYWDPQASPVDFLFIILRSFTDWLSHIIISANCDFQVPSLLNFELYMIVCIDHSFHF